MFRLLLSVAILVLVALPEGASAAGPKPKKVKCQNKNYPACNQKDLYCPDTCARDCLVDCSSCQPVCPNSGYPPVVTPPTPTSPPPEVTPPSPTTPPTPASPPPTAPYPPPPESEAAGGKRVRCGNNNYSCSMVEQRCPPGCPQTCEVDCEICKPVCTCDRPGAVCQDPRFVGADGITFYFHGKKDQDFCIVSDTNLHINAHFIGLRNQNVGRDFTWVQSLGILFDSHQLYIGAKKTATWDDTVDRLELSYDGVPVFLSEGEGAKWQPESAAGISITRSHDTNSVVIEVEGNFKIKAAVVP